MSTVEAARAPRPSRPNAGGRGSSRVQPVARPGAIAAGATRVPTTAQPARRQSRAARRVTPRWLPRGARLVALAIIALSVLGLAYLVQISRVASYGYTLSTLQERQARIDRDNELLVYRISDERTLDRVDDLARRAYGMQPIDPSKDARVVAATQPQPPSAKAKSSPETRLRFRFLSVERPATAPPPALAAPPQTLPLVDRLWRRIVGIGVAGPPSH